MNRAVIAVILAGVVIGLEFQPVLAQESPVPFVRALEAVSVVGQDEFLEVHGYVPSECAGTEVIASLFVRAAAQPSDITPLDGSASAVATIDSDGTFQTAIPIPPSLGRDPIRAWPGVTGSCLATALVDESLGVELAVRDEELNADGRSTVQLSSSALLTVSNGPERTPLGQFVGSVTAVSDGQTCSSVSVWPVHADSPPELPIGEAGQPEACSRSGARLIFFNERNEKLFVEMTLLPGVTRLLDNFARDPAGTGVPAPTTVVPGAPSAGTTADDPSSPWQSSIAVGVLIAAVGSIVILLFSAQRRRTS